jgi:hypothetical protein
VDNNAELESQIESLLKLDNVDLERALVEAVSLDKGFLAKLNLPVP